MMQVVHIITGLNGGGAETVLCRLLEALPKSRFRHVVIALGGVGALRARIARQAAIYHLDMKPGHIQLGDVTRLRGIVREANPDVVQGWMYHGNLMATMAALMRPIPVVWGVHHALEDLQRERKSTRLAIRAGRWLSCQPRSIIYCSGAGAGQHAAYGFCTRGAKVIPNGYDTLAFAPNIEARRRIRQELGISEGTLAIGLVARVHPVKDHANFLRAAAIYTAKRPDAVFVLVGDGTELGAPALSGLIDELALAGRIRLCGRRSDIAAVNNALDIASCSSWSEAFPNTVAEAMACGTPCVATDVGDVKDIIGDTGLIVSPRDPVALADGWLRLAVLGPNVCHDLGLRARARIASHYSLGAMADRYAGLYSELAEVRY